MRTISEKVGSKDTNGWSWQQSLPLPYRPQLTVFNQIRKQSSLFITSRQVRGQLLTILEIVPYHQWQWNSDVLISEPKTHRLRCKVKPINSNGKPELCLTYIYVLMDLVFAIRFTTVDLRYYFSTCDLVAAWGPQVNVFIHLFIELNRIHGCGTNRRRKCWTTFDWSTDHARKMSDLSWILTTRF